MKPMKPLAIANEHGNVDLTKTTLTKRYVHVPGKRLPAICKRLKIRFAEAVVDFDGDSRYGWKPIKDGVVVPSSKAEELRNAIAERDEQAEKDREKSIAKTSVLAALFTLNRRAKRCRDLASKHYENDQHGFARQMRKEKEHIYKLKGQCLHYLVDEGRLSPVGYHRFDGGNWSEILRGEGFCFHRPCPAPENANATIESIESIESKPKGSCEPTFEVAEIVVRNYLTEKPKVMIYEWGRKSRPQSKTGRHGDDDFDEIGDEDWFD